MIHQRILLAAFFFLIQTHLSAAAVEIDCDEYSGNYAAAYGANLNTALSSISTNVDSSGFYNASAGQGIDRVYALALCRGDVQGQLCRDCVRIAAARLVQSCPNRKRAIRWDYYCMVRYSDSPIVGILSTEPAYFIPDGGNATSQEEFKADLWELINDLRKKAAGASPRKVVAASAVGRDFQTIYALLQCTPDLSSDDCQNCLSGSISEIPNRCGGVVACVVFKPSCYLCYEDFLFFNEALLQEMEQPPSSLPVAEPPPQPSTGKGNGKSTRTIIIIVAALGVCLVLAVLAIIFLRRKKKKQPTKNLETLDEISSAESVQYAFSTIKAATNDFSVDNKLGRGGFGMVYKVSISGRCAKFKHIHSRAT